MFWAYGRGARAVVDDLGGTSRSPQPGRRSRLGHTFVSGARRDSSHSRRGLHDSIDAGFVATDCIADICVAGSVSRRAMGRSSRSCVEVPRPRLLMTGETATVNFDATPRSGLPRPKVEMPLRQRQKDETPTHLRYLDTVPRFRPHAGAPTLICGVLLWTTTA